MTLPTHRRVALFALIVAVPATLYTLPAAAQTTPPTITWGRCPPVIEGFPKVGKQECALLPVPLDYRAPNGRTIQIAISRIHAADPQKRRGVLLLNPGGLGGAGLDFPHLATAAFPQSVLDA